MITGLTYGIAIVLAIGGSVIALFAYELYLLLTDQF